jgi:peptidase E
MKWLWWFFIILGMFKFVFAAFTFFFDDHVAYGIEQMVVGIMFICFASQSSTISGYSSMVDRLLDTIGSLTNDLHSELLSKSRESRWN